MNRETTKAAIQAVRADLDKFPPSQLDLAYGMILRALEAAEPFIEQAAFEEAAEKELDIVDEEESHTMQSVFRISAERMGYYARRAIHE